MPVSKRSNHSGQKVCIVSEIETMLRLCYAPSSVTSRHSDLSVLWSLKILRALADGIEFAPPESSEKHEPPPGLAWLGFGFLMPDVQDTGQQWTRKFPRVSVGKTQRI